MGFILCSFDYITFSDVESKNIYCLLTWTTCNVDDAVNNSKVAIFSRVMVFLSFAFLQLYIEYIRFKERDEKCFQFIRNICISDDNAHDVNFYRIIFVASPLSIFVILSFSPFASGYVSSRMIMFLCIGNCVMLALMLNKGQRMRNHIKLLYQDSVLMRLFPIN